MAYTFLSLEDAISSAGTFWLYGAAAALGTVRPDPRPTHTQALIPPSPATESPGGREPSRVHSPMTHAVTQPPSPAAPADAAYRTPGVARTRDARDLWEIARGYPAPLRVTVAQCSRPRLARAARGSP